MSDTMTPEEIGAHAEARFSRIMNEMWHNRPSWFLGVLPAPPFFDHKKIDFFAYIQNKNEDGVIIMLIQIKSSVQRARTFEKTLRSIEICPVVVNESHNDDGIRNFVIPTLDSARRDESDRYARNRMLLLELEKVPLRGRALVAFENTKQLRGQFPHLTEELLKKLSQGYRIEWYDPERQAVHLVRRNP